MYKPAKIHISKQRKSDWLQHAYRVTCVIAQKYSSATFVTFRFRSGKEKKNRCVLKMSAFQLLKSLVNRVSLKVLSRGMSTNIHAPEWD